MLTWQLSCCIFVDSCYFKNEKKKRRVLNVILAQNGSVSNVTWTPDSSTIYAQIDQTKRHSVTAVVPLNPNMTAVSPPSGYVRLPPVDQFHLIPYADTSSSSPSPSQYSAQTQQVHNYSSYRSHIN